MQVFSGELLWVMAGAFAVLVLVLWLMLSSFRRRIDAGQRQAGWQMQDLAERVGELGNRQSQLYGGLAQVSDAQSASHTQLVRTVEERLGEVSKQMGETLHSTSRRTAHSLGELQERLNVIDKAQSNIEQLSGNVLGLQDILANKQTRGSFGEIQLEDLVRKAMPPDAYQFQHTFSNGRRVDCLITLPNPPGALAIDSKFPLEAFEALRKAEGKADAETAQKQLGQALLKHIKDIAERYILPGETADSALLFLPSEAVYAEVHSSQSEIIRKSFEYRVWIVSPTTLMATLNTVRAVLKDVRMREQAGIIRRELTLLHQDMLRLDERVKKLNQHFSAAQRDVQNIDVSAQKVIRRAHNLESFEFDGPEGQDNPSPDIDLPMAGGGSKA